MVIIYLSKIEITSIISEVERHSEEIMFRQIYQKKQKQKHNFS